MNLSMLKSVFCLASGFSASYVVGNAIKATTPVVIGRIGKIGVKIGTVALGGAAGAWAHDYTRGWIEELENNFKSYRNK